MEKKISAVYFSATNGGQKIAKAVAKAMAAGGEYNDFDITPQKSKKDYTFASDEAVVFAAPVYFGRIPPEALSHLQAIKGDNTPAIVTVAFGNRDYDDALLELCDFVQARGFVVIVAGAFSCKHTFGEIAITRPNAQDINEAEELGKIAAQKLEENKTTSIIAAVKGNRPYKEVKMNISFPPVCDKGACIKCGKCADICPTGAISHSDPTATNGSACMSCFACIKICPTEARKAKGIKYKLVATVMNKQLSKPQPNSLFI